MRSWRWTTALGLTLVSACAILAAGCGDTDSPSAGTATTGTPAVSPPVPSAGAVSIGSYVRGPGKSRVIVFVNGIFGDATSWTNGSTGNSWPRLLAADPDFADSDIYVHTFLSPHLTNAQQILELAGRMKDFLETDRVISSHAEVVFLCHSMGGLVTRAFLLNARMPPAKTPMIFFFATPTAGANIAGIAAHLSSNPQLKDMLPLEDGGYVKNLREQWLQTSNDPALDYPNKIASFCAYELEDTWAFRVVPELSATYLCNRETRAVNADHLGIVKPADQNAEQYRYFKAAYDRQFGREAEPIRMALARRISVPRTVPFAVSRRVVSLGQLRTGAAAAVVVLKQVKANDQPIEVDCEEEEKGTLVAKIDLGPGETVSEVHASLANAANLKESGAAVVREVGGTATISYRILGADRAAGACTGGGRADVIVSFVVTREAGSTRPHVEVPPRALEPVQPRTGIHTRMRITPHR